VSGGAAATGGSVAAGGTTATGGAPGGTTMGGSTATGGSVAAGGTAASGGASGGTNGGASGGRTGGSTAGGSGGTAASAGTSGGSASSAGKPGGSSGGNIGGSMTAGGTISTGGTTGSGGSTTSGSVGDVASFHCVNWADKGDNFQAGMLQPSGLSSSDSYATVKAKSDAILSGFQTVLGVNAIRIPINEATIVTNPTWWTAYKGILDSAISKNMQVIVAYWGQAGNNGGKPADTTVFYTMWKAVVDAYVSSDLVYFDIMNEPWALSPTAFITFAAAWLAQFPNVPHNRVVVAGNYNDSDVNQQGADPRLTGCLLSLHAYPSSSKTNTTTEQGWRDYIKAKVGSYYSRVIVTEWSGTPMSTGVDYSGDINGDVNKAYLVGVAGQIKDYGMGSCWWAGLETGNTYAIANVTGTGTNLSISVTNASGLARIQAAWGP
jgi:endoglucanase